MAHCIDDAQASQGGCHLGDIERVGLVLIKVPESALELLYLCRSKVTHVARHDLLPPYKKRNLGKTRDHAWLSIKEIFFAMLCTTSSSSNSRSWHVNTV